MKKEHETLTLELDIDVRVVDLPEISRVHTSLLYMLKDSPFASDRIVLKMQVIPANIDAPHAIYVMATRRLKHESATAAEFAKHAGVAVVKGLGPKHRHVGVKIIVEFGRQPLGHWERKTRKR